ncbi:MAG TPA: DNA-3-methyladenine glycosylase I [Thermomicrobiales bacterium]|nr:DNA-3-methyladenine glycosylase I [Thermomicrobiales bacterium]
MTVIRCEWAGTDPLMVAYHDEEWGVPVYDDGALFERLMLECNQAGLSWSTILKKRETFRAAYDGWDAATIANYGDDDIARLLENPAIIRNRAKVNAAIGNAGAVLELQAEGGFSNYVWSFVGGKPLVRDWQPAGHAGFVATTPESDAMSKALKKRGFKFVGSTICYAFMQSVGMVNDHDAGCFRSSEVAALAAVQ